MKGKWFKRIFGFFFVLISLLVGAIAVIPFIVDVDQYRPEIEKLANENINGKLSLGKLELSLWGQILVRVESVKVVDQIDKPVLVVSSSYFHFPFLPLIEGKPKVSFVMTEPKIRVIKDRKGEYNLLSLIKNEKDLPVSPSAPSPTPDTPDGADSIQSSGNQAEEKPEEIQIPKIVADASLDVEFQDSTVFYSDAITGLKNQLNKLNIRAQDISLSKPLKLKIWSDLETVLKSATGQELRVSGPFEIDAVAKSEFDNAKFKEAQINLAVDLNRMEVEVPGMFKKGKSVGMAAKLDLKASEEEVLIQSFRASFHNAEFRIQGNMTDLKRAPAMDFQFETNRIRLAPWSNLLPILSGYDLGGEVKLEGGMKGLTDQFNYRAKVDLKDVSALTPGVKGKPKFSGQIQVVTDSIEKFAVQMEAKGTKVLMTGSVQSFETPRLTAKIQSPGIDLNQLIELPPPSKSPKTPPSQSEQKGASSVTKTTAKQKSEEGEDLDKMLNPIRSNPMMTKVSADIESDIRLIKLYDIQISDLKTRLQYRNLVTVLNHSMKLWKGQFKNDFRVDLKPARPRYQFSGSVSGFVIEEAVRSQVQMFKNTLFGSLDFQMKGSGSSLNSEMAKRNLAMSGKMKVSNATFASIDIGRMATDAINSGIARAANKVGALKGKKVKSLPSGSFQYDSISSDFQIVNGRFNAPNFVGRAKKNRGLDIVGRTQVGLIDQKVNAKWQIRDTYNLTGAANLSASIAGQRIDRLLAKGNEPVLIPVTVGCTLDQPCYSYGEVPGHFANVALSKIGDVAKKAAEKKARDEIKKRAQPAVDQLKKNLEKKGSKPVKDVLKKFGF